MQSTVILCVEKGDGQMPKMIKQYKHAQLVSVEKLSDMEYQKWMWREMFVGYIGIFSILESENKYPGKRYLHLSDMHEYITTGYGEYEIKDNFITHTTRNSRYVFKILE